MNQKILTTDDVNSFFQISHHVDCIIKYHHEYTNRYENLLKNVEAKRYPVLLPDKLFFDAITFHFKAMSSLFRSFSERMHTTLPTNRVLDMVFTMGMWNEVEDISEFEEQYDDEIFEALHAIKAYETEIENYLNSKEFLNYELTISDFLKWKDKDGNLFVLSWLENIKEKSGIIIQFEKITDESIIRSWDLYNNQNKSNKVSLVKGINTNIPLYLYLMSLEYMVGLKDKNLIKHLPFTRIPTIHQTIHQTKHSIKSISPKEELPFCTDYPYSIKTSKSIWTVRKK